MSMFVVVMGRRWDLGVATFLYNSQTSQLEDSITSDLKAIFQYVLLDELESVSEYNIFYLRWTS